MKTTQPNQTLDNIAVDLERLAARADCLTPALPSDEAQALTDELCAIRALIDEATSRLQVLQQRYPEQLEAAA